MRFESDILITTGRRGNKAKISFRPIVLLKIMTVYYIYT